MGGVGVDTPTQGCVAGYDIPSMSLKHFVLLLVMCRQSMLSPGPLFPIKQAGSFAQIACSVEDV